MSDNKATGESPTTLIFSFLLDIGLFVAALSYGINGFASNNNHSIAGAIFACAFIYKKRDLWRRLA